jgi:hypothetical protein
MKIEWRAAAKLPRRTIAAWLAMLCALVIRAVPLAAQATPAPPAAAASQAPAATAAAVANSAAPARIHGAVSLDGPWRFQIGDDPMWADPKFDDSAWQTVTLGQPLADQGIDAYAGYAWYRLRLQPRQLSQFTNLPGSPQLDLLVTGDWIGQFAAYVNGAEAGHTRGMTDEPAMYQSPPFVVHLSAPQADGSIVVAIQTWAGAGVSIGGGLLRKVELGAQDDIADRQTQAADRQWDRHILSGMILSFLFLCVAALGFTLYLAQRNHSEYLWLALLCLSVAVMGAFEIAFALAVLSWAIFSVVSLWTGRIFMAVALEFVLRFTGGESRKFVRGVQIFLMLLPVLSLTHLDLVYKYLSVSAQVVFTALVSVMLFRAWRQGRKEAGVMLLPFLLAATGDSIDTLLDFAAGEHWIPDRFASHRFLLGPVEFSTSTVAFTVFLGSLMAVILYRFVTVSQEEQRSAAEIEAARSVQALLIPTQLPSNRHFMLESAYLPVNGVGGDFFQVLPIQDESILIVVGDVSGKGLQAAMNASTLVGALRNELSHDPATILNHLNQVMLGSASGMGAGKAANAVASFATCLCARIYTDGKMTIANAGHLSPYRDGREMQLAANLPLGLVPNIEYEQAPFQLSQGDRLIFLSDGVVEATNHQGELFGFERTQQVSNEPARYIAQTAKRFGQTDDITVVSLYFAASGSQGSRGQQ